MHAPWHSTCFVGFGVNGLPLKVMLLSYFFFVGCFMPPNSILELHITCGPKISNEINFKFQAHVK
jgi:hypothetical protein